MNKEFDTNFYLKKTFVSQINIVFRKRKLSRERERERETRLLRDFSSFLFSVSPYAHLEEEALKNRHQTVTHVNLNKNCGRNKKYFEIKSIPDFFLLIRIFISFYYHSQYLKYQKPKISHHISRIIGISTVLQIFIFLHAWYIMSTEISL